MVMVASLLSVMAAAQSSGQNNSGLNIPDNVQFVTKSDPNVRKATAIVNGEVITESDIDQRLALLLGPNQSQLPAEDLPRARAQVLRGLIDETLQIQAAAQQDLTVEDRDVDQYYAGMARENHQTPQAFAQYLRSLGSSDRSLKRQLRGQIAWQRLRGRWIDQFVSVSDDEVAQAIARMNASRGTPEYHVAEIYMSTMPETTTQVRATAEQVVQQLRAGAPFPTLARQVSEATTAARGGDLGWVRVDQLPAELASLVPQMQIGQVSNVIEVPGGYSIIMLVDERHILVSDPRDAVLSLMQLSLTMPANTTQQQAQQRAAALEQATQSMGGCGRAADVARAQGAELISNDQVTVRELPPQLQQMLLNLNVGQVTPPFGTSERISVLVLCGRDDPQSASTPNAAQIEEQMRNERINRRAQRYLRDLRRDAVIDYR